MNVTEDLESELEIKDSRRRMLVFGLALLSEPPSVLQYMFVFLVLLNEYFMATVIFINYLSWS